MASAAAAQAIRRFRVQEIKSLPRYIIRYGPLPPVAPSSASPSTVSSSTSQTSLSPQVRLPNPFVPRKDPTSGKWQKPKYSLRQQAELAKKAKAAGLLDLLPPCSKVTNQRNRKDSNSKVAGTGNLKGARPETTSNPGTSSMVNRIQPGAVPDKETLWMFPVSWHGTKEKAVPGAESGTRLYAGKKRMFKGHKWERVKGRREFRRKILMRDMAKRVKMYKSLYKRRRPNPLKPSRSTKTKIPF